MGQVDSSTDNHVENGQGQDGPVQNAREKRHYPAIVMVITHFTLSRM